MSNTHNKPIRGVHTAVVVAGDIVVFLAFVIFGKVEPEITLGQALLRTALSFGFIWVVCSPWLGGYKASTLYNLSTMAWKIPLIWLLCSLVALVGRALLTDGSLILSFAIVSIAVQGVLLSSWRGVFMLTVTKLTPSPSRQTRL